MKKIYACGEATPVDEQSNQTLLDMVEVENYIKGYFSKEKYDKYIISFHDFMRVKLKLPNKVFGIVYTKDHTKARIICFDKEPDGNIYDVHVEDDTNKLYILVSEE